jgi:hypothetical protein
MPSSSAAAATVWTLPAASSAATATVAACIAAMLAVSVIPWAAVCSWAAEFDTAPTMPTMVCSKLSASSARARLRSAEASASARRRASACSAASPATMRLIPSTARPTAPISSPRAAPAISLSISPRPIRSRVRTKRLRGAVTPRTTTATPAAMAATRPMDAAATSVRVARAADRSDASRSCCSSAVRTSIRACASSHSFARSGLPSLSRMSRASSLSPCSALATTRSMTAPSAVSVRLMSALAACRSAVSANFPRLSIWPKACALARLIRVSYPASCDSRVSRTTFRAWTDISLTSIWRPRINARRLACTSMM